MKSIKGNEKLSPVNTFTTGTKLSSTENKFKVSFEVKLDNGYELKNMTPEHLREFHKFISETVYKGLTIAEVDKLYLRKAGLSNAPAIMSHGKELLHYGKDRTTFRIFGYYNLEGYFIVCRLDGGHKTNRE